MWFVVTLNCGIKFQKEKWNQQLLKWHVNNKARTLHVCAYISTQKNAWSTLLDFAVILQLLTVKKYSKIPYIWFTVNYCNTHCIMGISVLILQ